MKQRLTDAALDLMWENSYGTTSVDAICERAGAKKGSFYYFFKSKSELTVAALEAEWEKNKANMDALFSNNSPLEQFDLLIMCTTVWLNLKRSAAPSSDALAKHRGEVSTQNRSVRLPRHIWDRKIKY
jgi:TetR/AcrR family transcriptional repressor of nem operon